MSRKIDTYIRTHRDPSSTVHALRRVNVLSKKNRDNISRDTEKSVRVFVSCGFLFHFYLANFSFEVFFCVCTAHAGDVKTRDKTVNNL